ncbi:MAG: exodeoxyribonuclease V subunit gamma [Candidatus Thiodiazotropha sp.]
MLILHQSNRLEYLARRLAERLGQPVRDPLRPDWVVVQHPGMARWLSLELAQTLGIAANIEFPLPAVFVWELFRQLLDEVPQQDRYQPQRLTWRIHDLLTQRHLADDSSPLSGYLASGDELRRFQLAQELATLYDRYLLYRPDWIDAWERGESAVDGDGWQAELWRDLVASEGRHWVSLQQRFFSQSPDTDNLDLPPRLYLFGVPTLSPGYLQIINRVAQTIDVHLFLLNPCATHWADIVPRQTQARQELNSSADELYLEVGHPLLATLGRQGRDFFAAINELDPGSEELFEPADHDSLLARLQNQILQLEAPESGAIADDSISFHLCHSPMREVEVLYDQLIAMFEAIPHLSPNDILVMTPEIDRYAPLIEAVFGEPGDRPAIPFRISDRTLLQRNPLAASLLGLLELPGSRYTMGQLLNLLQQSAIQRRFGLDEAAVEALTQWLIAAGIRWGRDGESKSAWGLPTDSGNTWRAGLQRLLLGYAMPGGADELWRQILPLDAAEGGMAEVLGGLLACCDRLFNLEDELAASRTVSAWRDDLLDLLQTFFQVDSERQEQLDELREIVQQFAEEAVEAGFTGKISLELVRYRLQAMLEGGDGRGFLGGGVSCCALAPMRSLPFRVICLLGMNDGAFPRRQPSPGFDLMAGAFRLGDRSRRVDDRYLFLETLISARERLTISYVGRSQRDNSPLPPAVVVDELCDTLRQMTGESGLAQMTHRHPLQSFSPAYFEGSPGLFTYSAQRREAAMRVARGERSDAPLAPLPLSQVEAAESTDLPLAGLLDFFSNPPRLFARERLQLSLEAVAELADDREPFELDRFLRHDNERALVEALLRGVPAETLSKRLIAAGELPHGQTGDLEFKRMLTQAEAMVKQLRPLLAGGERSGRDINLLLADCRLSGRLHDLLPSGRLVYTTDRFHPYLLLRHWIEHLSLNLAAPSGIARETHLVEGERYGIYHSPDDPKALLESLVALYREGLNRPLPFYPATAWAYMEGLARGGEEKALERAQNKWYGNAYQGGDAVKPYNRLLWPDGDCFGPGFGSLAQAILEPLLAHLEWR